MLLEVPPVIVSPGINAPFTLEQITTPCNTLPEDEYEVIFVAVVPSLSYNSKSFVPGFLTVNTSLVDIATELFWAEIALNVICWPSFKPCAVADTTPGLATVIDDAATAVVVDILSTVPVAPEVEPVIVSPVVND